MKIKFDKDYIIETTYDQSPMRKNTYTVTKVEELEGRELSDYESRIRRERERNGEEINFRFSLTKEERTIEKTREYKKLFNGGSEFEVKSGINVLVGDNGCGKSTLINKLLKENPKVNVIHVDMEEANPNINTPGPQKGITYTIEEINNQFMWSAESHGETREGVLMALLSIDMNEFDLVILDEPEQGLSLKNQIKYFNKLKEMNIDVLIVTHSKVFIELSETVFDVETMNWIDSKEYLNNIYNNG